MVAGTLLYPIWGKPAAAWPAIVDADWIVVILLNVSAGETFPGADVAGYVMALSYRLEILAAPDFCREAFQ